MWSNDIKCKYMFMFPLKNLPPKGFSHTGMNIPILSHWTSGWMKSMNVMMNVLTYLHLLTFISKWSHKTHSIRMIQNQGDYNKEVHFTDGNVSVHNNSISTPDLWQYRAIVETICRCFTKSTVLTHWNLGDMVVVLIIKEIIVSDIFFFKHYFQIVTTLMTSQHRFR